MGIPIGKCDVITAFGGVRPDWVLPVLLDVGTDNNALLNNSLYIGRQCRRDNSPAYDQLVDEFVQSLVHRYGPTTLIQFEDFGGRNAFRFLAKYRQQYCVYDDDIQGAAPASRRANASLCELGADTRGSACASMAPQARRRWCWRACWARPASRA